MKLCMQRERKHSEAIAEGFAKTFQTHAAINLECGNLLISILAEDLAPDTKKQVEDNVVGSVS